MSTTTSASSCGGGSTNFFSTANDDDDYVVPSLKDAYELRAKDLTKLDPKERDKLTEEIHGLLELPAETPEMVQWHLTEFQRALDRIPDKAAYNKARLMNASYVNDPKLILMALRAEHFESANRAARRYVNHFELKLHLFGIDKLARPL